MNAMIAELYNAAIANKQFLEEIYKADAQNIPVSNAPEETKLFFVSMYKGWLIAKYGFAWRTWAANSKSSLTELIDLDINRHIAPMGVSLIHVEGFLSWQLINFSEIDFDVVSRLHDVAIGRNCKLQIAAHDKNLLFHFLPIE